MGESHCPRCKEQLSDTDLHNDVARSEYEDDELTDVRRRERAEKEGKKAAESARARPVAEWMLKEFHRGDGVLRQRDAAKRIAICFGEEFTYKNDNGNPAIIQSVLDQFRLLTEATVVWDKTRFLWRRRRPEDELRSRGVE
jgi:hypothetical protein